VFYSVVTEPIEHMRFMRIIVVPLLTIHWKTVAAALHFTPSEIETIAHNNMDQKKCCVEMLEEWINTDKGLRPSTWPVFLKAITSAGLASEADAIKKSLEKENEL